MDNTKLLIDADAQRAGILLALKYWLPAHVNAGSTDVYVFFSGHGLLREPDKQYYWLPQDVNTDLLEDNRPQGLRIPASILCFAASMPNLARSSRWV